MRRRTSSFFTFLIKKEAINISTFFGYNIAVEKSIFFKLNLLKHGSRKKRIILYVFKT